MVHADVRRVMAHASVRETQELAVYLSSLLRQLADGGAQTATIPAFSPQICARELAEITPLPLIDLLDASSPKLIAERSFPSSVRASRWKRSCSVNYGTETSSRPSRARSIHSRRVHCLNAKSRRSTRCCERLNSAVKLIQRTTSEAPQRRYVLHRTGCSQEDDQLLREGCNWSCAPGRQDRIDPARTPDGGELSCHGGGVVFKLTP